MKSYDKASWHIDAGEKKEDVMKRFKVVFDFLNEKEMLNDEGEETYELGMNNNVSINSNMVNKDGKRFLDGYYDAVLDHNPEKINSNLKMAYEEFSK